MDRCGEIAQDGRLWPRCLTEECACVRGPGLCWEPHSCFPGRGLPTACQPSPGPPGTVGGCVQQVTYGRTKGLRPTQSPPHPVWGESHHRAGMRSLPGSRCGHMAKWNSSSSFPEAPRHRKGPFSSRARERGGVMSASQPLDAGLHVGRECGCPSPSHPLAGQGSGPPV